MSENNSVHASNFDTFLDMILIDCDGEGKDIEGSSEKALFEDFDPEARETSHVVLSYSDENLCSPFAIDAVRNSVAYYATLAALIQLRMHWKGGYEGNNVFDWIVTMENDILDTVGLLNTFKATLTAIRTGDKTVDANVTAASKAKTTAEDRLLKASADLERAKQARGLYRTLTLGPMEQLAKAQSDK